MTEGQKERAYKVLSWMVPQLVWKFDEAKSNFGNYNKGGYPQELQDAIDLLAELEAGISKEGMTPLEIAERRAKETGDARDLVKYMCLRKERDEERAKI